VPSDATLRGRATCWSIASEYMNGNHISNSLQPVLFYQVKRGRRLESIHQDAGAVSRKRPSACE